jgi:photosystem II stability/assembly factor-like uncharacterized protein
MAIGLAGTLAAQQPTAPPAPGQSETAPGGVFRLPSAYEVPKEAPKPEEPKQVVLQNSGKPMIVPFACTEDDIHAFGMACTESDPCPVYLELTSVHPLGSRIFAVGNLHNGNSTMYSVMLASEDEGKTWTEPVERVKGAGLDMIQFVDFEAGWIAGQTLGALPRDPFFLLTTDGGKTWRKRPVYSESRIGTVEKFWFESRTAGTLIIDHAQGAENNARYEVLESMTGGESWMIRQLSAAPPQLKGARDSEAATGWRLRADQRTKAHVMERKSGSGYGAVASFSVQVGECKPAASPLPEPPPEPPKQQPATVTPPRTPARPPTLKKQP